MMFQSRSAESDPGEAGDTEPVVQPQPWPGDTAEQLWATEPGEVGAESGQHWPAAETAADCGSGQDAGKYCSAAVKQKFFFITL